MKTATVYRCPCPPTDWHHLPQHCDDRYEVEIEAYVGPEYAITHPAPPEPKPPHPEPEVRAREALVEEIPTGAKRIMNLAREVAWEVRATYARGTTPGGKVVDVVALKILGEDKVLVATWEDGKFRTAWKIQPEVEKFETLAALKEVLARASG